ncbi:MAG: hypothetical protein WDW36_004546 [Sanguina aurantia]
MRAQTSWSARGSEAAQAHSKPTSVKKEQAKPKTGNKRKAVKHKPSHSKKTKK